MKLCTVFRTLLLGCVAFYSSRAPAANAPEPADIIIYNAKVITASPEPTSAQAGPVRIDLNNGRFVTGNPTSTPTQAIAVRGDQIVAVGTQAQLETYKGPNTQMIDAQSRTIMPGLYDSHVHSYKAAVSELNGPRPVVDSIVTAQEFIRRQAAKKPPGSWIIIEGVYPSRLKEGRLPTKSELDEATTNNPVCWHFGNVAVVNSKALQVSGITNGFADPPDGEVVKEPRHLKPTGLLRNASGLLKLPPAPRPPTPQQERAALKHLYQLYNQQGITSIGEKDADTRAIDMFRDLNRSNELTVRITCTRPFPVSANFDDDVALLDSMTNTPHGKLPYGPTGAGDDWVRIGPLETVMDGDLLTATAYLRTPWGIGPTYEIAEPSYSGASAKPTTTDQRTTPRIGTDRWECGKMATRDRQTKTNWDLLGLVSATQRARLVDSGWQGQNRSSRWVSHGPCITEPATLHWSRIERLQLDETYSRIGSVQLANRVL